MDTPKENWISSKAGIRKSDIGGWGLFAKELIKKGENVVKWGGEYTDTKGAQIAKGLGKLVMQWDTDLWSVEDRGAEDAYYINHSCDSNTWMEGAFSLVARKDIDPGDEITADYSLWEADENYISKWKCNCKAKECRGKVTGKDWENADLQKKYKDHFSPLINKRISSLT